MRKPFCTILLVLLILSFGCDPNQGSFEDSIPDMITLTTQVSPVQAGTIHPSEGVFNSGEEIQIVARPAEGYIFDHWEGDLTGNSNPATIQFNSSKALTAHFSSRDFNLTIESIGEGYVIESVVERSSEVTVELRAVAEEGWFFDRWEGDLAGSNNPEIIIIEENEEKSVTAVFEQVVPEEYAVTISTEGLGSVEKDPDKEIYTEGEEITLTADAALGWKFSEWKGDLSGSSNPETIVADADKQITAIFEIDVDFGITVQEVKLYIREMKLDGARRTRDFNTKDFILNIPLDGSSFEITHVDIPRGFYDELELDIRKPENKIETDDPDFRDGSGSYSLVVKGTFNGVDFTYRSEEDFEIDVDISPNLEIKSGQTTVIAITIDFAGWFEDENDMFLDPNAPLNTKQINKNIKDSFSDFEDDF